VTTGAAASTLTLLAAPSTSSQLFGSFLIGLREGLEAAIVVSILVAFLVKSGRRDALKWVWLGVGSAVLMTVVVFLGIQLGENTIQDLAAEAFAGVASLLAVVIVTSMVLWMKKASAGLSGELRDGMTRALDTGGVAVLALSFLAVGREGLETALFMVGYANASTAWPLTGLILGVLVAAAIAYAMYRGAVRFDLGKFFRYTGIFLIVVAAGILSYGIGALQTVGWLPVLTGKAFDVSALFTWSSDHLFGRFMQGLTGAVEGIFNVSPNPTVLQLLCWAGYLIVVLMVFLRPARTTVETPTQRSAERSTT